jgi:hypothetical protein
MMDKTISARASVALGVFALLAAMLFHQSWSKGQILFSNDGPLGLLSAQAEAPGTALTGYWQDLYWIGSEQVPAFPNVTQALFFLLGPGLWGKAGAVVFAKFYAPLALLLLGCATWLFCRQMGFRPQVCLLAGIASMLNGDAFSNACWGLPSWVITRAMFFLALAALVTRLPRRSVLTPMLAGFCIGIGVMEGFDLGAIFSLYGAAFGLFWLGFRETGSDDGRYRKALVYVTIMALCAVWIAMHTLVSLVGTQIRDVAGTQQDERTKEDRWAFATSGSLPKLEALRVIIPGLFGFRMDTRDGGQYWGAVNRMPQVEAILLQADQGNPVEREQARQSLRQLQGNPYAFRHSGSGEYAGVFVVLVAIWASIQSFRGQASPYCLSDRRLIWFWLGAAVVSLLLAFGRHAPFYEIIYQIPYVSTIRNPIKFMQPLQVALIILFAYGLDDLFGRYLAKTASANSVRETCRRWWTTGHGFDRGWVIGMAITFGVAVLGILLFVSRREELLHYLQLTGFSPDQATAVARFALRELLWFSLFLGLSAAALGALLSGLLTGSRAKWAALILGLLLVVDLSRANGPWIVYENYLAKYESNPVIERLRERSYEHRVAMGPNAGVPSLQGFHAQIYHALWLQHHFPYYNVQSLDMPQEPRVAEEKVAYVSTLGSNPTRYWQLTNTRYLFGLTQFSTPQGPVDYVALLNEQLDPERHRFSVKHAFTLVQDASGQGVNAVTNDIGPYALIEYGGALPRARLYANWRTETNLPAVLAELASPAFDPEKVVLVSSPLPSPSPANTTIDHPGSVVFTDYAPKRIRLAVTAKVPAVLLLNDRFHPAWRVSVDGQPAELLRANYLMRGVYLPAGAHEVEFRFQPSVKPLLASVTALLCGIVICGLVCVRCAHPSLPQRNARQHTDLSESTRTPSARQNPSRKDAGHHHDAGASGKLSTQ